MLIMKVNNVKSEMENKIIELVKDLYEKQDNRINKVNAKIKEEVHGSISDYCTEMLNNATAEVREASAEFQAKLNQVKKQ
jgi:hypothetical protein